MCPQKAELLASRAHEASVALARGRDWVAGLLDGEGRLGGSDLASLYFKAPAALTLAGDLGRALQTIDWVARHHVGAGGELTVPRDQPAARTYDRGWLLWGASLCGRPDLTHWLGQDLLRYQNPATGGFWEDPQQTTGTHHAMTAGMAGVALLAAGHVDAARRTGNFLIELLRRQPTPDAGFHLAIEADADGLGAVVADRTSSDFVDRTATRQRPARLGPVQILFARLSRLLGDRRYLEAALDYTHIFLDGAPGMYDCVEAHKFLWGLEELHALTGHERLQQAADRVVAYLLARQEPEGLWLADALGNGSREQSLDLRVNTTLNVLVGLGYHIHLRVAHPTR